MPSNRYESTEIERRNWLHLPSGTNDPLAVTHNKYMKYKDISAKIDTPLFNNMEHMRVSGIEPSLVILCQTYLNYKTLKCDA